MPGTRNQEERIRILDELFSGNRKWTSEELIKRIGEETGDSTITERTLFRYFKYLEEKGAPLHRWEKSDNYYYYTGKFSLKNLPLDEDEVSALKSAIQILRQVDNFELLSEVDLVIKKLENRIHSNIPESRTNVQFEKHTASAGHEYFNNLFDAVKSQIPIRLSYQSFLRDSPVEQIVHPYLLKEFRNRWFLIGRQGNSRRISTYALDRIKKVRTSDEVFLSNDLFDPDTYYENVIGVTVIENAKPDLIEIKAYKSCAPYIISKPIHKNQKIVKKNKDGSVVVHLSLIINYELKSILLSYGEGIEIRKPASLRTQIKTELVKMIDHY